MQNTSDQLQMFGEEMGGGQKIKQPHIITFGSPCQDFSLAGKRKGMEGQRSSLILHAIRLIRELRPNFFIWENVKGTFSSNDGADFWAIISAFANIGGYRLEWQLLNTSWFLPQNRERIYLIGHLGEGSGKNIFPITKNDGLFNEQDKAGQRRTQTENSTTINEGRMRADDTFIQVPKVAGDLTDGGLHSDITICVAQRGRNPENPSDRTTGVQKDNLIMSGTWRTHKDGQGFREVQDGNSPTIPARARARQDGSGQPVIKVNDSIHGEIYLNKHSNIRRLTEIECERLQGFADDWTKFGNYDGKVKEIPKTQRYKMLGNAVTVNVVKAIGERLINNVRG